MAVGAGEAEFGGQFAADGVAQQQGNGTSALLMQRHIQCSCYCVFAAVLIAGEKDGEALLEPGWMGFSEHTDHFGVGEPFGDVLA